MATQRRKWYVLDSETDPFVSGRVPEDFAWGVYDGSEFRYWWNERESFIRWLRGQECLFFAHNAGRFDIYLLLAGDVDSFHGKVHVINHRLVSVRFGCAEIRDSWTLIPMALSAYKKDVIDYSKFEAEVREEHKAEIVEYLRGDCVYLYELLESFFAENPGFPLTLPSAAMKQLARRIEQPVPRVHAGFDAQMRPYYYGGRCEAFKKGCFPDVDLELLDINSAYPCAMLDPHWWGTDCEIGRDLPAEPEALDVSMVRLRARSRGALPFRASSGALEFPADGAEREFSVTGHEVRAGLETGTLDILEVLEVQTPFVTVGFAAYVEHYWAQKQAAEAAGDTARRWVAKIMLNGAYGKFAQNPEDFCDYRWAEEGDDFEEAADFYRFHGRYVLGFPAPVKRYYNVATAASITGQVRAQLWRAICASEGVFYCDTDSLLCMRGGVDIGSGLGQWKREANVTAIAIAGKKLYAADTRESVQHTQLTTHKVGCKIASKGVKLSRREIWEVAAGGIVEWCSEAPTFSPRHMGGAFITRKVRRT